ncbi:mannitol dehydrogenase family protein [Methylobacterium sp. NEAU 140]|uniref:mannitol dehydrogenase family protein n=1 Tax=Methylobacterium sp. NEAU 140 TaxID=3064945 RepID=UPI002733C357|nr:mannitol dehydrogenase family protein [Methylobacterium sp. NEAU 140]MDP4022972.1 mannitol dehydrogenase family protein [Methylobacterium sp. NEAU 140]
MTGRILQFGTSRFLQAHVDLFVHEAREAGQRVGPISVVQVSGSAARAGRVAAFGNPAGYPVIIRGLEDGAPVERRVTVTSIDRGLSAAADWGVVRRHFDEADYVVSNTGDSGYETGAERLDLAAAGAVPDSFPGKLAALLHHRWQAGARAPTILPCELVSRNGQVLQGIVLRLAEAAGAPTGFRDWLRGDVVWADTLVDRIVSEPLEPVGAVAEPYALWAIARRPGLVLPCTHPCIVLADDLEPFERLKLHILNLGHTLLADRWMREGRAPDATVRALLDDDGVRGWLEGVYRDEVLPGFRLRGMGPEAEAYVATTLERFRNPFLDHRLADIAGSHATKVARRLSAFRDWVGQGSGAEPDTPALTAAIARAA